MKEGTRCGLLLSSGCGVRLVLGVAVCPRLLQPAQGFLFTEDSGKGCPSLSWAPGLGGRSCRSQEHSLSALHLGRACRQEKDNPPVSESSFHLQLGANPIAGSNLILH